jgi:threonine dehydratase
MRDGRLVRIQVPLDDRPGSLAALGSAIASCGANILEVEHRRHDLTTPVGLVVVELLLETRGHDHIEEILDRLRSTRYDVVCP